MNLYFLFSFLKQLVILAIYIFRHALFTVIENQKPEVQRPG